MITKSKSQTQKLAEKLAKQILKAQSSLSMGDLPKGENRKARIVALHGDLGAGKTTFVQGFIKALGVRHHVTSPTFVIVRKYHLSEKSKVESRKFLNVFHFDLYRIHGPNEILALGFKKIINDPQNIVLIEWPERIKKLLPKNIIRINFEHGRNEKERVIQVTGKR